MIGDITTVAIRFAPGSGRNISPTWLKVLTGRHGTFDLGAAPIRVRVRVRVPSEEIENATLMSVDLIIYHVGTLSWGWD